MMAGVVRRDGLREAVTALRDKWVSDEGRTWISNCGDELSLVLDAVPDVPPTTPLADHIKAGMLRGRVRLSDVPPDPPAADRDELARVLTEHAEPIWGNHNGEQWGCRSCDFVVTLWDEAEEDDRTGDEISRLFNLHVVDAAYASGVLVDAADVRAREADAIAHAIREAAKKPPHILADNAQRVWMAGMDRAQKIAAGIAAGIRMGVDRAASERDRGTT